MFSLFRLAISTKQGCLGSIVGRELDQQAQSQMVRFDVNGPEIMAKDHEL
jgi:hypothetical protein